MILDHYTIDFESMAPEWDAADVNEHLQRALLKWLKQKQVSCEALQLRSDQFKQSVIPGRSSYLVLVVNKASCEVEFRNYFSEVSEISQIVHLDMYDRVKYSVAVSLPYGKHDHTVILPNCNVRMNKVHSPFL